MAEKTLKTRILVKYDTFANYQLAENMAKNENNAYKLLDEIWKPALKKAKEELADITFSFIETGNTFVKDGKTYHIPSKPLQAKQAYLSHLSFQGKWLYQGGADDGRWREL